VGRTRRRNTMTTHSGNRWHCQGGGCGKYSGECVRVTSNQCGNDWVGPWRTVFDPIDGTKSFITGKPLFGTLVALLKAGHARYLSPRSSPRHQRLLSPMDVRG
jgi:hypothetical protein